MRIVGWVTLEELRQTARDPHVAVFLLFPVLFYPLLVWAVVQATLVVQGQNEAATWRIDALGPPEIVDALLEGNVAVEGGEPALHDGGADLVVRATIEGERWTVSVAYSGVRARSRAALAQAGERLRETRSRRIEDVAVSLGLTEADRAPYRVRVESDVTTRETIERTAALLLALLVPISLVISGLYPAVDLVVSEREKGTIETTLSSAAPRLSLLLGRLATCVLLMLAGALGNAVGMALTANQLAAMVGGDAGLLWVPRPTLLLAVPVVVSTAALVAATYFLALVPARTFKEGEYFATFAMLLGVVPIFAVLPVLTNDADPGLLAWAPLSNAPIALREAALGEAHPAQLAAAVATNLGLAGLFAGLAARAASSEAFLFGDHLPGWLAWIRRGPP